MIETLLMPFQFPFMQQAFIISVLVALPMGLLSPYLVLKGWSLMGDAISHAVLPGIVIAYVAGLPLALGAFAAGLACAIATGFLKDNSRIKEDTAMGVVFSGMFGLGLVMFVAIETSVHLNHILFGDVLGTTWRDIAETGAIAGATVLALIVFGRDLMLFSFDPGHARTVGLKVRLLHYGLLTMLSLTIVGGLQAVGIILAIAFLIAPGAIAFLMTRTFRAMVLVAASVAVFSAALGIYLSFFIDSAPAPTIVLVMSALFLAAFAWSQIRDRVVQAETARHGPL
ncbi:iron chelate uptake ABC transporter family permease subunit [Aliihoeflea aestuarii]|jgi:manganese/iron transport system permease protein|uniref:metal ABC transporter permease n=1 Tax=Aliihoeflea aestuarii TaxID=453840 RepID=UPI0020920769|nr:metal ABC transporter permease [Aliihoeflea aestuarii]MCO6391709.1 iron chelate uptake ABC transporter family permease subunit [Aliihoeflea aestuarii]